MTSRRALIRSLAAAALGAGALALPAVASPPPPTDPSCAALVGGTTGVLVAGGQVPSPEQAQGKRGGFGPVATGPVARTLPDVVAIKTPTETFTLEYAVALRGGRMYVRPARVGVGLRTEPWHSLELPGCLDGHVRAIAGDGRLLLALGADRRIYSHDMPGGDLSPQRWTWRWGPYFWSGLGAQVWPDVRAWAPSELTSGEHFTDTSGRERTPLGVATVYLLRGDGHRITYLDPWLPADESRQVCGPRRGSVPLAGLSASGSTVFAAGRDGSLWTRLYDFDVSGANTVFGDYSWHTGRPASDTRWQLPGPQWVRQPDVPGVLTDRLLIAKTGLASADRVLRVAGRAGSGAPGWWEKRILDRAWRFVPSSAAPLGQRLPVRTSTDRWRETVYSFVGTAAGASVRVAGFDPVCSPTPVRVTVAPGIGVTLLLHTVDGLRQETRAQGLDDTPREYNAALEMPLPVWRSLGQADPRVRAWVAGVFGSGSSASRFAVAPVAVTATRMRFLRQCWTFVVAGGVARLDVPRVPPDLGMVVGRATEQKQDGWGPSTCPP